MGVGVYFGTACYGYAFLKCIFVYFGIQGTRLLFERKQKVIYFIYNKIHICSNKHETGLVLIMQVLK